MNKFFTLQKVKIDKDVRGLRRLLDQTKISMRNLWPLNVETDIYGTLLVPLINYKLPGNVRISIAKNAEDDIWNIETLVEFLRKKVKAKKRSFAVGAFFGNNPQHDFYIKIFSSSPLHYQQKTFHKNRCAFCNRDNHFSNKCLKVTDPKARTKLVKQQWLCFVYLEKGHSAASCKKHYSCNKCGG